MQASVHPSAQFKGIEFALDPLHGPDGLSRRGEGDLDLDHEGDLCEGRGGRGAEEGRGLDG
jgi:hypothetical protein